MATTIEWSTKIISVLQADLTYLSPGKYELDVDVFRLDLRDLEDGEDGIVFPSTHTHNTASTLSGATYARQVSIINGYTIEFEDTGTPYQVTCVGANHNIGDVKTVNQVSLVIGNSAGLIEVSTGGGGGLNAQEVRDAMTLAPTPLTPLEDSSIDQRLRDIYRINGLESGTTLEITDTTRKVNDGASDVIEQTIDDDGTTTTVERA